MNVWRCPKCGWQKEQPTCVTGMRHRCNPSIPRETALVPVPQPTREETPT